MRVGFLPVHLSERGTTVATIDYAEQNEDILGNESFIFYELGNPHNFQENIDYVHTRFAGRVFPYEGPHGYRSKVKEAKLDVLYVIKYGHNDGVGEGIEGSPPPRLCIHSVFVAGRHGDRYAFVSEWLSGKYAFEAGRTPFVPHMINLPWAGSEENLRESLGIPPEAFVLGCYGGRDSFNIPWVPPVLKELLQTLPNLYLLFMNIEVKSLEGENRVIFLPGTISKPFKVRFIQTCDAMIHARAEGETFGLAVGEFSTLNKPIMTWAHGKDKEHLRILGDAALTYDDPVSLKKLILKGRSPGLWNRYQDYTPELVMAKFKQVFLD